MAKIKQKKQSSDEWFDAVVTNGLSFLHSSVERLENDAKFAIIDLYTAIELFFKARLMKEHWALILTKPDEANKVKFENGDFQSVYLKQAVNRLEKICGEEFDNAAIENFNALNGHRNQLVHFAHTDFFHGNSSVVIEHWASWYYLHNLLTEQWRPYFESYEDKFQQLQRKVNKNKGYLSAKFEALKCQIEIERKKGNEIEECPSCKLESAVITKTYNWGHDIECLVCDVKKLKLKDIRTEIKCDSCKKSMEYFMLTDEFCPHCSAEITPEYALEQYSYLYEKEDPDCLIQDGCDYIAYCHTCGDKKPSVVYVDGLWVCVFCEDRGWTATHCNHCDSFVTGDVQRVEDFACHRCEDEVRDDILAGFN
ncbi:hypothetical protein [Photobacterium iliopiscarium]|uniref:HsdR n=1 Tax=Photobacterium iliopiscarium TaxID=56192 RepID=A0A2T3MP75_9GAMM|nr:hypothetical protein [Photobacterium iliopiscarium]PSV98736.1 hypothetical protein C9I88_04730 [Photobacterium iliopiscarium]